MGNFSGQGSDQLPVAACRPAPRLSTMMGAGVSRRTVAVRTGILAAGASAAVLLFAAPAAAHVTVDPGSATQGEFAKVAFRVPNEKDDASTVAVEVNLPTATPIAEVTLRPVPGWTAQTTTTKLATPIAGDDGPVTEAVTKITWKAAKGGGIKAGEYQDFEVSLGPLPKTDQVIFKVLQTYSDGDIVRWIDEPTASGAEPEHPAPVLALSPPDAASGTATSDPTAGGGLLGLLGFAFGLIGLGIALMAYRRASRPEVVPLRPRHEAPEEGPGERRL